MFRIYFIILYKTKKIAPGLIPNSQSLALLFLILAIEKFKMCK